MRLLVILALLATLSPLDGRFDWGPPAALADDDGGGDDGGDDDGDDDGGADRDDDDDDARGDSLRDTAFGRLIDDVFGGASRGDDANERLARELVTFHLDAGDRAALANLGFFILETRRLAGLGATLSRLLAPQGLSLDDALATARAAAPGATLDVNHLYRSGGEICPGGACWGVELVRLSADSADACAGGAPIAIVDTAVDARHPSLRGARIERRSFLSDGVESAAPEHGTAVAALLVGRASPLAPGARLLAAEAVGLRGGEPRADAAAIVAALDWAVAARAAEDVSPPGRDEATGHGVVRAPGGRCR